MRFVLTLIKNKNLILTYAYLYIKKRHALDHFYCQKSLSIYNRKVKYKSLYTQRESFTALPPTNFHLNPELPNSESLRLPYYLLVFSKRFSIIRINNRLCYLTHLTIYRFVTFNHFIHSYTKVSTAQIIYVKCYKIDVLENLPEK